MTSRVLVVDDDPEVLDVMTESLRSAGYVVEATSRPSTVSEIVRVRPPDLLITDEWMPDMNGAVVIGILRGMGYTFPVIITTALLERNGTLGDHLALSKPFELEDLLTAVQTLIGPAEGDKDATDRAD